MIDKQYLDWASKYVGRSPASHKACLDLSDLTIIVPTYKRPEYAIRTIAYWSRHQVNINVMDGSPEALPDSFLKAVATTSNLNYHHEPISLPERIRIAIARVRTKYVMCLADDDFYLPRGLRGAMQILVANENAVACMGQSVGLDVDESSRPYLFSYGESLRGYKVEGSTASERMRRGICDYRSAAFYAMYRRDTFEKIWKNIERSSCPEQIEYEQAMRAYMEGILLTSGEPYWVRSFECDPVASPLDGARSTDFTSWFGASTHDEEKNDFINRLTHTFCMNMSLSKDEGRALVLELCNRIVTGSHVGLSSPPSPTAGALIRLKMLMSRGPAAGLINHLRNSEVGVRLRTLFLHSSRKKLGGDNWDFPGNIAEASEVLTFVGQFISARGGDS